MAVAGLGTDNDMGDMGNALGVREGIVAAVVGTTVLVAVAAVGGTMSLVVVGAVAGTMFVVVVGFGQVAVYVLLCRKYIETYKHRHVSCRRWDIRGRWT